VAEVRIWFSDKIHVYIHIPVVNSQLGNLRGIQFRSAAPVCGVGFLNTDGEGPKRVYVTYACKIKENMDIGYLYKFDKHQPMGTILIETYMFIQLLLMKAMR
jgi:hypothetical protein